MMLCKILSVMVKVYLGAKDFFQLKSAKDFMIFLFRFLTPAKIFVYLITKYRRCGVIVRTSS